VPKKPSRKAFLAFLIPPAIIILAAILSPHFGEKGYQTLLNITNLPFCATLCLLVGLKSLTKNPHTVSTHPLKTIGATTLSLSLCILISYSITTQILEEPSPKTLRWILLAQR
jgi:peptidoglycan/LPS O-acetylase OafA/YrhL